MRNQPPFAIRRTSTDGAGAVIRDVAIGVGVALAAVAFRLSLPLAPVQIPTLTVVVAIAVVTTFRGVVAGTATAFVGGLLSWYLFFTPYSWSLAGEGAIPLAGFAIIASVIITTSHLYRRSERRRHEAQLSFLQAEAETSELFAREMAHRLKNALAIVQSIAFQTLGSESSEAGKFAGRLKTLADAHNLLTEHVAQPTAEVSEVIETALEPFDDEKQRVRIEGAGGRIAAQHAVSLALALHELCTNASKYGALSSPAGWVSLQVRDLGDRVELEWKEHGGPAVQTPDRLGFGTKLLRRLGMNSQVLFEPDGVRSRLSLRKPA